MLQSPSFPWELGPLNQVESLRKRRERPQQGLGRRPTDKSNLVYFSLKMWQLAATILMILLTANWPNFVQFPMQLDVVSLSTGLSW